jgi:hypothetical protein
LTETDGCKKSEEEDLKNELRKKKVEKDEEEKKQKREEAEIDGCDANCNGQKEGVVYTQGHGR